MYHLLKTASNVSNNHLLHPAFSSRSCGVDCLFPKRSNSSAILVVLPCSACVLPSHLLPALAPYKTSGAGRVFLEAFLISLIAPTSGSKFMRSYCHDRTLLECLSCFPLIGDAFPLSSRSVVVLSPTPFYFPVNALIVISTS